MTASREAIDGLISASRSEKQLLWLEAIQATNDTGKATSSQACCLFVNFKYL